MFVLHAQTYHQIFSLLLSVAMNGITALALGLALKRKNKKKKNKVANYGILSVSDIVTLIF